MSNIIITGGNGVLATELTKHLLKDKNTYVILVSRHPECIKKKTNLQIVDLHQLVNDKELIDKNYDSLIHTAFSRSLDCSELLNSLNYLEEVLLVARQLKLKSFINISSQSVYGTKNSKDLLCSEICQIAPNDSYAIAKSFSEMLVNSLLESQTINYSSIRLASLLSYKERSRFINKLVEKAKNGEELTIYGGNQQYSFIDVSDAAEGIVSMIEKNDNTWEKVYNLGFGKSFSLYDLALMVVEIAEDKYNKDIKINILPSKNDSCIGMNISLFKRDFSWEPKINIKTSIQNLFVNDGKGK